MKRIKINFKYIIFSLIFIFLSLTSAHSAYASGTQYTHYCNDGGMITSFVNISQSTFTASSPTTFTASAQVNSTCSTRIVSLTAQNNSDGAVTLISSTIGPGPYPFSPNLTTFSSPSATGSTYKVHFVTNVTEPTCVYDLNANPTYFRHATITAPYSVGHNIYVNYSYKYVDGFGNPGGPSYQTLMFPANTTSKSFEISGVNEDVKEFYFESFSPSTINDEYQNTICGFGFKLPY